MLSVTGNNKISDMITKNELIIISVKILFIELFAELIIMKLILPPLEGYLSQSTLDYLDPFFLILITTPLIVVIITGPFIKKKKEVIEMEKNLIESYQVQNQELKKSMKKVEQEELKSAYWDMNQKDATEKIILYGSPISPSSNFVKYVMDYFNDSYQFESKNIFPSIEEENWDGIIFEMNQIQLKEANAICRYLSCRKKPDFCGKNLIDQCRIDEMLCFIERDIRRPVISIITNKYFLKNMENQFNREKKEKELKSIHDHLRYFDGVLKGSYFLMGSYISLVDLSFIASLEPAEICLIDLYQYKNVLHWRKRMMKEIFYGKNHTAFSENFMRLMEAAGQQHIFYSVCEN